MIFNKFKREKNKKIETMAENDKGIRAQSDNQGEEIKHAPDKLIVEKEVKKLTKEESDAKMNEYYQKEELYVFLSNANADYEQGYSVPFLGQEPDDKIVIYIFSTIEKAKKHIKKIKLQLVDGIYPIGLVKKEDEYTNLDMICTIGLALGANSIGFDIDDKETLIGCKLEYFMEINNITTDMKVILADGEKKILAEDSTVKMPVRFNAMKIVDFTNPFIITQSKAKELLDHVFKDKDQGEDFFANKGNIHDLCFVMDYLVLNMVKQAQEQKNQADVEKIRAVNRKLQPILIKKLQQEPYLYTLIDNETEDVYLQQETCFLLYSGRYANRVSGNHKYQLINGGFDHFLYMTHGLKYKAVSITNGPQVKYIMFKEEFMDLCKNLEEDKNEE